MGNKLLAPAEAFDFSHWPIVIARMPAFEQFRMNVWTGGLDRALSARQPFVLIIHLEEFLKDPRESAEEKRRGAIWMKQNRVALQERCLGNVYIVPSEQAAEAILEETRKQGDSFGIVFDAAVNLEDAMAIAHRLLARNI